MVSEADSQDNAELALRRRVAAAFEQAARVHEDTQEWAYDTLEKLLRMVASGLAQYDDDELVSVLTQTILGEPSQQTGDDEDGDAATLDLPPGPPLETLRRFLPKDMRGWVGDMRFVVMYARQLQFDGMYQKFTPMRFVRVKEKDWSKHYHGRSAIIHTDRGYTFQKGSQRPGPIGQQAASTGAVSESEYNALLGISSPLSGTSTAKAPGRVPRPRDCADLASSWSASCAVSGSWKGSRKTRPWADTPGPGYYKEVLRSKAIVTPQRGEFSRAGTRRVPCALLSYGVASHARFGHAEAPTSSVYTLGNVVEFRTREKVTAANAAQIVDSILREGRALLEARKISSPLLSLADKTFSIHKFYCPTWLEERGIQDWRIQLLCHTLEARNELTKVLEARAGEKTDDGKRFVRKPGVKKLNASSSAPELQTA
jgi:hypothetical protein